MAIRVDDAEIRRVVRELGSQAVAAEADRIRNGLVRGTPRDSARTANAWRVQQDVTGDDLVVRARVVNDVAAGDSGRMVWELLHEGTGIHGPMGRLIRPVRRRALRWPSRGGGRGSDGAFTFSAWSRGIEPRDFVVRAIEGSTQFRVRIFSRPGTRIPRGGS